MKQLLTQASVISLREGQVLYTFLQEDFMIYFMLFGQVNLYTTSDESDPQNPEKNVLLGKLTLGWTLGEEVLFNSSLQIRTE